MYDEINARSWDLLLQNVMIVPEDAVVVKALCWIKPEVELLFSSRAYTSVAVYVGLQDPIPSFFVA